MAGSVNKVILVGHLGADPDIRRTASGDPIANFSLATSESWKDKQSGERRDRTEWHRIVVFNEKLAKIAEEYLKKGAKVFIEGSLQTRKWQDNTGTDKYTTEVVLQRFRGEIQMLDKRDGNRPPPAGDQNDYGYQSSGSNTSNQNQERDDEIPF